MVANLRLRRSSMKINSIGSKLLHQLKTIPAGYSIILLVATALILIWFREGILMATGEAGLFIYNPKRQFDTMRYAWWDTDTGVASPHAIVLTPFYFFTSLLQLLGVSNVTIQASIFWLVLALDGLTVCYLTSTLIKDETRHIAGILSGLFYMLNPYVMAAVWGRFLPTSILLTPLLPLMLTFYFKGLEEQKTSYVFHICITSWIFSIALSTPAYIGTIWIPLFSYFVFHIVKNRHRKDKIINAFKFSTLLVAFWFFFNAWWILQFIVVAPSTLVEAGSPLVNLNLLISSSEDYGGLFYVIRLIHRSFTYEVDIWRMICSSSIFEFISFIIPVTVFSSLLFKRKNGYVWFFFSLSLLGLFLAKGTAPPFGEVMIWLFTYFPSLGVFRNPFEKFGVILPLSYAFLFGVGLSSFYYWLKNYFDQQISHRWTNRGSSLKSMFGFLQPKIRKIVAKSPVIMIAILVLGVYLWPMWTGTIFKDHYASVPSYYPEADNWLSQQPGDFRVISLPIGGEGITYNWEYVYRGAELSSQLFRKPFISRTIRENNVDAIVARLPALLYRTRDLWKVMDILNAKYLTVHHDINYTERNMDSPENVTRQLTNAIIPGNLSSTLITNADSIEGWFAQQGNARISIDPVIRRDEIASVKVTISSNMSSLSWASVTFQPNLEVDLSKCEYLRFWYRASVANLTAYQIGLIDNVGRSAYWSFPYNLQGIWNYYELDLRKPSESSPMLPDMRFIKQLVIRVKQPQTPVDVLFWINDIKAETGYVTRCESLQGWTIGEEGREVDNNTYVSGNRSVMTPFLGIQRGQGAWTTYTLPSWTDWSLKQYIGFWLRLDSVNNLGDLRVWVDSASGRFQYHIYNLPPPNKWTRYLIPKREFSPMEPTARWSNITRINFAIDVNDLYNGHLWIDDITADSGVQTTQKYISFQGSFGMLDFYRVDDKYFLPRIYATNQFIFREDVDDMLFNTIPSNGFDPRISVVFLNSQSGINNVTMLKSLSTDRLYKPNIAFEKIDPTKYVAHVINSSYPYFLILSETYSPQWRAYVNGEQVPDEHHFIANGYANAWYITKGGSYDVTVEFYPQKLVYYGAIVSLAALTSCLVYMFRNRLKTLLASLRRALKSSKVN